MQVSRIGGAVVVGLLVCTLLGRAAAAPQPDVIPDATGCSAGAGLPASVRVPREIRKRIETMLQRSPTFREQCRRLAEAPWLHVLVRLTIDFEPRTQRALSTSKRPQPQFMLAMVDLAATSDPAMWLSHEFEHLIEQIDGVDVARLGDDRLQAWQIRPGVFETSRAIRAGEAVSMRSMRDGATTNL